MCRLFLVVLLMMLFAAQPAHAGVKVNKAKPDVKVSVFDPIRPPAFLSDPNQKEDAVTTSDFGCAVRLLMQPTTRKLPGGKYQTSLQVNGLEFELDVKIVLYLPKNVTPKLKAHEEGHQRITEKVYAEVADRAAKVAGQQLDGKKFEAEAATAAESEKLAQDALSAAHTAMIRAYLAETSQAGRKVQEEYDRATAHGTNRNLAEGDAIRQSWEKFPPALWTQPTTKPGKSG